MNLMNQLVSHKAFGEGKITEHTDSYLNIAFATGDKRFVFPDSFELFLKAKDPQISEHVCELLKNLSSEKEMKAAERLIELEKTIQMHKSKAISSISRSKKNFSKEHQRANVAFKCNFCDRGQTSEQTGFNGAERVSI